MSNKYGMTFNGVRKDYVVTLRGKRRPAWAPLKRNLITVPGMPGAHNQSTDVEPLPLNIPILIESSSLAELKTMKEDLASWLVTDEPKELIFDDEPTRIYYAMIDGSFDPDELIRVGTGVLNFICIDPYKYKATLETVDFTSDFEVVNNAGTVDTYPTFLATVTAPITNLDIITNDAYMRVGQPQPLEETPFEPETLIFHDELTSLTGWGPATYVDNGYVSGTINTDGVTFFPATWGTTIQPPMWQGPSLKKSLPEAVQDFKMEALLNLENSIGLTGMIEIYLLDAADNVVGKIGVEDRFAATYETLGKARAGDINGSWIFSEGHEGWKNFSGMLRLTRTDNQWYAYVAVVEADGTHTQRRGSTGNLYYYDANMAYMNPVAQIQISFRHFPGATPCPMRVHDLKMYRLNLPTTVDLPYIAYAGDIIQIDHKTNDIKVNGESRIDLKDFGASYFPLKTGANPITYGPSDKVNLNVEWRERYK